MGKVNIVAAALILIGTGAWAATAPLRVTPHRRPRTRESFFHGRATRISDPHAPAMGR